MKYKATVSFAGNVSMYKGEIRNLKADIANPLLKCGYLEKLTTEKKAGNKKDESKRTDS